MSSYIQYIINNKDTLLTDIANIAFQSVDTDKSGSIDVGELETIMAQISSEMGAEPPTKEDAKEILKNLDKDRSGSIDQKEFIYFIENILSALVE